jgi:hypothetical protein
MKSASTKPTQERSVSDIAENIRELALTQHSVATMLHELFISISDDSDGDGLRQRTDQLWEGFAAIASNVAKDCAHISNLVDDLQHQLPKDGVRERPYPRIHAHRAARCAAPHHHTDRRCDGRPIGCSRCSTNCSGSNGKIRSRRASLSERSMTCWSRIRSRGAAP